MFRLILAGLFVMAGIGLAMFVFSSLGFKEPPPLAAPVLLFVLVGAAMLLFNRGNHLELNGRDSEEQLRRWQEQGLVVSTDYRARRAFQVEEREDEGLHYYLELEDGAVLYLNGQYLYDYEPIEDDPELHQARSFPCTEFTLHRNRKGNFVIAIDCRGRVLEPEEVQPPFTNAEWTAFDPQDGQVIQDRSYEEIRGRRARSGV